MTSIFRMFGNVALIGGTAATFAPPGTRVFATAEECVDFIRRDRREPIPLGTVPTGKVDTLLFLPIILYFFYARYFAFFS